MENNNNSNNNGGDGDDDDIDEIVLRAVVAIDSGKKNQVLQTPSRVPLINGPSARCIVNCLKQNPHAVDQLYIRFDQLSQRAMRIYRQYCCTTSTLRRIFIDGPLGNTRGRRFLSGLHGSTCISIVELHNVELEGSADILSDLLLHNSQMKTLFCGHFRLGPAGALALDRGIRRNNTLDMLILYRCSLQDDGVLAVANALDENHTVTCISLRENQITSNCLPHVTRLLQRTSIEELDLGNNPGLFTDEESTKLFASALQKSTLLVLCLNLCRLPNHALAALFQAVAKHPTLKNLGVVNSRRTPLQGVGLKSLQDNLPQMNVLQMNINLDCSDPFLLSCLSKNKTLCHIFNSPTPLLEEITTGPVFVI